MDVVLDGLMTLLILPLQLLMIPIDYLLSNIEGIEMIPDAITAVMDFIGSIPETLVTLMGINPVLWNVIFVLFVFYIGAAPSIQIIKKVWAWIRP